MPSVTQQDVIRLVYREARLIDEKRFDEWYDLFAEDAYYWVPLTHDQPDGLNHTSLAWEDKLLLKLRLERLKNSRSYSQHPVSRCVHVLQQPEIELAERERWITRTQFVYLESRGDDQQTYGGHVLHTVVLRDGALSILLKRVNLINCDAALPSIQMFL
ncbi:MAG: phenylpropionate dioxygenase [Betaproteobacteria bacterium]|nr:phenylpropionate dioxygenase [Betaproteobacteria bacterium]